MKKQSLIKKAAKNYHWQSKMVLEQLLHPSEAGKPPKSLKSC